MNAAAQTVSISRGQSREPRAITRARERYGLELTLADLDAISVDVARGRTMRLASQPDGATRHAVLVRERALIAVISVDGRVVTFIPREKPLSGGRPYQGGRP